MSIPERPDNSPEARMADVVERAVLYGIFEGQERNRREFFKLVGSATALAIIADIFPLNQVKAWAADAAGKPEKTDLKVGFIPITCATPLIMAEPMGFYKKHGLNV